MVLRARSAMSGTDIACAVARPRRSRRRSDGMCYAICLRCCYAMPGTDIAYGARTRTRTR
eukprot:3496326-Rhodomonas_salina.4